MDDLSVLPVPLHAQPAESADGVSLDGAAFHVVGVGASAGGLEALEQFFEAFVEMVTSDGLGCLSYDRLVSGIAAKVGTKVSRRTGND